MTTPSAEAAKPGGGHTAPGAVVGGRFEIERAVSEDALGAVLAAKDTKTGKAIALRMLPASLIAGAAASEGLRAGVRTAAALPHKNLVAAFGAGQDPHAGWYVASEWAEGPLLTQIVDFRRASGLGGTSVRGAIEVAMQVCAALTAAHVKTVHGGVRPSVLWVAKNGRVKLGDLGVTRSLLKTSGAKAFGEAEQAWLAPEVKADAAPDALLGTVRIRYQRVDSGKVEEIEARLEADSVLRPAHLASAHFRVAASAAEFAELLRGSPYAAGGSFQMAADYLRPATLELSLDTRVKELLDLITAMAAMAGR